MSLLEVQTNQPAPFSPSHFPVKKGDVLVGRVVERKGPFQYRVRIGQQVISVNSRLDLSNGQLLVMELKEVGTRIHLRLISTIQRLQARGQIKQLARQFGFSADALTLDFFRLSIQFGLVMRLDELKLLKSIYRKYRWENPLPGDIFLLPYFVQSGIFAHLALADPFFLLKWYWGLEDSREKSRRQPKKSAESVPASPEHEARIESLVTSEAWQDPTPFDRYLRWAIQQFLNTAIADGEKMETAGFWQDCFRFLEEQLRRYQNGKWAIFPTDFEGHSRFLFVRKEPLAKAFRTRFHFEVEHPIWRVIQVRGDCTDGEIRVVFYNDHKEFPQVVDSHKISLKEKLMQLGFRKVNLSYTKGIQPGQGFRQMLEHSVSMVDKVA
ncbi:MAG: hypothetical protein GXO78_03470 [Calditrichaeota bacterium]|nr:hypothetical protein [Calditrichota bacterium]